LEDKVENSNVKLDKLNSESKDIGLKLSNIVYIELITKDKLSKEACIDPNENRL
jgi:hypothetical protein